MALGWAAARAENQRGWESKKTTATSRGFVTRCCAEYDRIPLHGSRTFPDNTTLHCAQLIGEIHATCRLNGRSNYTVPHAFRFLRETDYVGETTTGRGLPGGGAAGIVERAAAPRSAVPVGGATDGRTGSLFVRTSEWTMNVVVRGATEEISVREWHRRLGSLSASTAIQITLSNTTDKQGS